MIFDVYLTRNKEVGVVIRKKSVKEISTTLYSRNIEVIKDMLIRELSSSGYSNVKIIEREDMIIFICRGTSPLDYGKINSITDVLEHRVQVKIFGSTMHSLTVFKSNEPLKGNEFVGYFVENLPEERRDRYRIINKIANKLAEDYGLIFSRYGQNYLLTLSLEGVVLKSSIVFDFEEQKYLLKKVTKILSDVQARELLKQIISRAIRKKMKLNGFVPIGANKLMKIKPVKALGKVSVYESFSFNVFYFEDGRVGLSIRPHYRIITGVSLLEYFDNDPSNLKLFLPVLKGRATFFDEKRKGTLQNIIFVGDSEYTKLAKDNNLQEPIVEIRSFGEAIYRPASEVRIAFTTKDVHFDSALREVFKEFSKKPYETLELAKTYINLISPLDLGFAKLTFSKEPMEVFYDEG